MAAGFLPEVVKTKRNDDKLPCTTSGFFMALFSNYVYMSRGLPFVAAVICVGDGYVEIDILVDRQEGCVSVAKISGGSPKTIVTVNYIGFLKKNY